MKKSLAVYGAIAVTVAALVATWNRPPAASPLPTVSEVVDLPAATASPMPPTAVPPTSTPQPVEATAVPATVQPTVPVATPTMVPLVASSETPGPRAMTYYALRNPNNVSIDVEHVITNTVGFRYVFTSTIDARQTTIYRLRDIDAVKSPFNGAMTLSAPLPFNAVVAGYDYP